MVLNSNISNGSFTESQGTRYKMGYLYNDSGQRTRKTVYQGDGISIDSITIYHYDQQGYLITETTETGALIKDYIWQQGLHPVAQIDASMPAQAGMPSEGIIYLHTDHLLTNRLATDATREVIWRWEGEAFGNTPALGSVSVNLRFPGQYYDAETNLHYNHFRYYDPELGRYITSDPIGLSGGMNTYVYVGNNSINFIDSIGLHKGDPLYGYGKKFWNWLHREEGGDLIKELKDPNIKQVPKDVAEPYYKEWKKKKDAGGYVDPEIFEWLIPWPLTPSELGADPCELPGGPPCFPEPNECK